MCKRSGRKRTRNDIKRKHKLKRLGYELRRLRAVNKTLRKHLKRLTTPLPTIYEDDELEGELEGEQDDATLETGLENLSLA